MNVVAWVIIIVLAIIAIILFGVILAWYMRKQKQNKEKGG